MKTILITAIGSFSAEVVIRKAKELGWRVVGTDIYPRSWVANGLLVDHFKQVALARAGDTYQRDIFECCEKWNIDYVVTSTDDEVDLLAPVRMQLQQRTGAKLLLSPTPALNRLRNKAELAHFLMTQEICTTIPGNLLSQLTTQQIQQLSFPVILKPINGRSSQGMHRIKSLSDFINIKESISPERAKEYLVQPYLEGAVITVDVFNDIKNANCTALCRRELLRTSNGAGLTVEIFRHPKLEKICQKIATATGVIGTACFEFIESGENYYFLECNPRFSGGVEFSEMAGFPCVRNHLELFGELPITPANLPTANLTIARRQQAFITENE